MMGKNAFYILIAYLMFCSQGIGAPHITFTPTAQKAYNEVMNLRFQDARESILDIKKQDPDNYVYHFIENYIDFFTLFIGENAIDFKKLKSNKDIRLNQLKKTPTSSPYYLYCQAEINLQWALVRLKFEEYTKAFFEIKSAYNDLHTNSKKFPSFVANKKSLGVLHAAIGTIPDEYRWGVSWIGGMQGSIDQGIKELEEVIAYGKKKSFLFHQEAVVMYAFTMLHLNNEPERAWRIISGGNLDPKTSPLACFSLANMAIRTGRNELAIQYLQNRPSGNAYSTFLYLDYMLGIAKLHRLDDDAELYLKKYVSQFKGLNYIKEGYQKLAWARLIKDDLAGYHQYMSKVITSGNDQLDEDKTALKEAKSSLVPNAILLQARLLFDGGYSLRAYKLINSFSEHSFTSQVEKLEYLYRKARITQSLKNMPEAINGYKKTIQLGAKHTSYYACSAALQLGIIYENLNNDKLAKHYYDQCLLMKPDSYKNSLHQKAKAGINRIKN